MSELDFATYSKDRKIQKELEVIIAAKFPTSQQIARFLYHLLLTTNHVNLFYHQEDCGIKPKPAAFFILLDMIENKQKWFELGLNPDDLEGYFAETYNAIRDCYEYIKNDPAVLRFAKFKVINEIINNEEGKNFLSCLHRLKFQIRR
ncbi:MAG: hypothetical protein HWD59_12970 [Coxiellaceae bacterium]|nr:MAG: hypothetical protein HWD59_12970 [Coxiellaceae bacterium]